MTPYVCQMLPTMHALGVIESDPLPCTGPCHNKNKDVDEICTIAAKAREVNPTVFCSVTVANPLPWSALSQGFTLC